MQVYYLLLLRQMFIFSASLIHSYLRSGCAILIRGRLSPPPPISKIIISLKDRIYGPFLLLEVCSVGYKRLMKIDASYLIQY